MWRRSWPGCVKAMTSHLAARGQLGGPGRGGGPRAARVRGRRGAGRLRSGQPGAPARQPAEAAPRDRGAGGGAADRRRGRRWRTAMRCARCATGPCSSCCTGPGPGFPRRSGSTSTTSASSPGGQCPPGQGGLGGGRAGRAAAAAATVRLAGKGGKDRVVPVGRYAREALEAYLVRARPTLAAAARQASASPAVFLNARGGRLTRQGAWGVLKAAADRAGLAGSPRTRCGTPTPRTCSTAGRTCGWSRNCSGTRR